MSIFEEIENMRSKIEKAEIECYRRMYREATPPANFDELLENAPINKEGFKVIKFMDYVLSEKRQDEIIKEVLEEFKITRKRDKRAVENRVALGVSPKYEK